MTAGRFLFATTAFLGLAGLAAPMAAGAQAADPRPRLGFSLAERGPGNRIDGPLLGRARVAFAAAGQSEAAWRAFLTPDAELQLVTFAGAQRQVAPFTAQIVRAAAASCVGPYAYDEGADWVQLSWVCRTDNVGPLAPLFTFHDSPELSLTIWFEGGLIKTIEAMEPLSIPGRRRYAMNAWEAAQRNH